MAFEDVAFAIHRPGSRNSHPHPRGRPSAYAGVIMDQLRQKHPTLGARQISNLASAAHAAHVLAAAKRPARYRWFEGRTRVLTVLGTILRTELLKEDDSYLAPLAGRTAMLAMADALLASIQPGETLSTAEGEKRLRGLWAAIGPQIVEAYKPARP